MAGWRSGAEPCRASANCQPEHPHVQTGRLGPVGCRGACGTAVGSGPSPPTSEGGPAPLDSWLRHIKARVDSPTTGDHLVGWAVLWGPAVGQGWALVLLEGGRSGMGLGRGPCTAPCPPLPPHCLSSTDRSPTQTQALQLFRAPHALPCMFTSPLLTGQVSAQKPRLGKSP